VESAKLLREAADTLDSRAAMQIRYLDTIQGIAKSNNPKVMFLNLSSHQYENENPSIDAKKTQL
jgi:erythrocyte band 7 integral membrane protein